MVNFKLSTLVPIQVIRLFRGGVRVVLSIIRNRPFRRAMQVATFPSLRRRPTRVVTVLGRFRPVSRSIRGAPDTAAHRTWRT